MVAEDFPWPSLGGGLIRLAKMVETVSAMGEVDLFSLYDPARTSPVLPPSLHVQRMEIAGLSRRGESALVAMVVAAAGYAEGSLHEKLRPLATGRLRGLRRG